MKRLLSGAAIIVVAALAYGLTTTMRIARADSAAPGPTSGYSLHIDAEQHFGAADPMRIAHHWCKTISSELSECQLYDSDGPNAKLVGVETIVPAAVWQTLPPSEQALWHYHKLEIPKVHATLPGMSPADAAKVVASIENTYGKVWILWNPATSANPVGQPSVTILK